MNQREMLLRVKQLLDENGIEFWLICGTLLGAYRDNNFISWDTKDIDIGIYYKDYWKVRKIIDESEFSYKWIWRKEFAIHYGEEFHPHLDFFTFDKDKHNCYWYFYTPNPINKIWNVEHRCKMDKKIIEPLGEIEFLDTIFKVPNDIEGFLKECYTEDWRAPNNNWNWSKMPFVDKEYEPITAIVPTFLRDDCLKNLISSFRQYYPTMPLIIGYQGKPTQEFNLDENTKMILLPDDCGLAYSRNALVNEVKTPMTWLLDDDFVISPTAKVHEMAEIFGADEKIGIVSGRFFQNGSIFPYEKLFEFSGDILFTAHWEALHKAQIVHLLKHNRTFYSYADICHNFFLAKTEVLKKYAWDNRHKVHSEHISFYLNLKINSDIKVVFCPNITVIHDKKVTNTYNTFRKRQYYNLIYEDFGIRIGYTLGEDVIMNFKDNRIERLEK